MGVRFTAEYTTINTNDDILVEIDDSTFSGTSTELKGTGADWFQDTLQKINVREPLSSNIQKREVSVSLWVRSQTFIDDLFNATEGRFKIIYSKNSVQEWEGYVLPDLCSYRQVEDELWNLKIVAKDFTVFEGNDYTFQDGRVTVISAISSILSNEFSLPIFTQTSWIVDGTTTANDFLREVYIDEFALREYARTGDETDEKLTQFEALDWILRSCGAIIRQIGGSFYITQLTELDDPTSVTQNEYNSSGVFQAQTTENITSAVKPLLTSDNNHNGGIKSVRVKYEHRTTVSNIQFPDVIELDSTAGSEQDFTQLIISDGTQRIVFSSTIFAEINSGDANGRVQYAIKAGDYFYDVSDDTWKDTGFSGVNEFDLTFVGPGAGTAGTELWIGSLSVTTSTLPSDADGSLIISIKRALSDTNTAEVTRWEDTSIEIRNPIASQNSDFIDYKLTQSGDQSVRVEYNTTYFGDGPVDFSRGAFSKTSSGDYTADDWARRSELPSPTYLNHHNNLLREVLDVQRKARRRISATVKESFDWTNVITYDSKNYYLLGGTFNGYTGDYSVELYEINIETGTDTFEDLPKFLPEGLTGDVQATSGSSPSGGLTESEANAIYFQQANNLSEGTPSTIRSNIGLEIGTNVQAHSSNLDNLAVGNGTNLTSVGTLNAGSITIGFGSIDIGTSTLDAGTTSLSGNLSISETAPRVNLFESDTTDTNYRIIVDGGEFQVNLINDSGNFLNAPFRIESGFGTNNFRLRNTALEINKQTDISADTTISANLTIDGSVESKIDLARGTGSASIRMTNDSDDLILRAGTNTEVNIDDANSTITNTVSGTNRLEVTSSGADVTGVLTATSNIIGDADLKSDNFSTGTSGTGWTVDGGVGFGAIDSAGNYWTYTDNLTVRGTLKVYELIAKQISAIGGTEILSIANGYAESVSGSAGSEVVTMEDPAGGNAVKFSDGDLCVVQRFDPNSSTLIKSEYRTVTVASGLDVTFTSTTGAPSPLDVIEEGDFIVVYGNNGDTAGRDSIIYRNVEGNPIVRLQSNVDSYSDFNNPTSTTQVAYGDLDGLVSGINTTEFGMAIGDMTLAGNHVLLTDSQASLQFDVFELSAGPLTLSSTNKRFSINQSVIIDDTTTFDINARTGSEVTYFSYSSDFASTTEEITQDITADVGDDVIRVDGVTFRIDAEESLSFTQDANIRMWVEANDGSTWERITTKYTYGFGTITYPDYGGGNAQDPRSVSYPFDISDAIVNGQAGEPLVIQPNDKYTSYRIHVQNFSADTNYGVTDVVGNETLQTTQVNESTFFSRDVNLSNRLRLYSSDDDSYVQFITRREDDEDSGLKVLNIYRQAFIDGLFIEENLIDSYTTST